MRKTPHLSTNPGKHIRLRLRTGVAVEGKFKEKTKNGYVVLTIDGEDQRFHAGDIDKFIVFKSAVQPR